MASMRIPNVQQTYEDFKPIVEEKDTPEALLLLVHLPGFSREQVGASFEADTRKIKVFGEKPLENNKRKRFKEEYAIPETCDSDELKGKFDGTVITITMPKKPISSVITPKEPKPIEEAKQVTPPSKTYGVEEGAKGVSQEQSKSEMESQRESDQKKDETATPPEATTAESQRPQKDKREITQRGGIKEEEKQRDEMEAKDASTPKTDGGSSMPQKGMLEDEKHKENKAEKTSEAGEEPQKAQTLAREASKEKGSSGLKTPEKRKNEEGVKTGKVNQREHGTKESELPIAKGIRDIASSASQAITRLAERVREEDKQKLLYAGAAILMVAVGIYANFKLRPGGRQ